MSILLPVLGALLWGAAAEGSAGDHVRLGDATLTPYIDLGYEFRSNVAQYETAAIPGSALRFGPGLTIEASNPDMEWDLGLEYEGRKFLGKELANYDRFTDFAFNTKLDVLKAQVVGLRLSEEAGFRSDPSQDRYREAPFHSQFRNAVTGELVFRVGPALAFAPGGVWEFDDFLVPQAGGQVSLNRRNTMGPTLEAKWDFFPRTALVLDGSVLFNNWAENTLDASGQVQGVGIGSDTVSIPDSRFYRLASGVRGRFTERLVVTTMLGYGVATYLEDTGSGDVGSDVDLNGLDGLLVTFQAAYSMSERHRLAFGYRKDFLDSFFTNYTAYNYVYGRLENEIGKRFGNRVELGMRAENYQGQIQRTDLLVLLREDVSYDLQDYASLGLGVWWTRRASTHNEVEYDDVNVHLLTTFTY